VGLGDDADMEGDQAEAWVSAGLLEPDAPDAAARRELLAVLAARGATTDQMQQAHASGRLAALAGELVTHPERERLSVEAAARRLGMEVPRMRRALLAAGLSIDDADPLPITDAEIEALVAFERGAALVGDDLALAFTRLLGNAAARVAEASVEVFAVELSGRAADRLDEMEYGRASLAAVEATQVVPDAFTHLLQQHLHRSVRRALLERSTEEPAVVETTIGFVDLVGSTSWTRTRSNLELARALEQFESAAFELASAHGGWIVKMVGDCAMYEVPDPIAACRIGLELCAVAQACADLPEARGGVAAGPVQARGGDYFGTTVNLAARAEPVAQPSTLAVNDVVADRLDVSGLPAGWILERLPDQPLRGFDAPVPLWALSVSTHLS